MSAMPSVPEASPAGAGPDARESPRPWKRKFGNAWRGLKRGMRGQSSFSVHFFFAALVIAAAIVLRCTLEQWGLLFICIGGVLTAELFNSAVEFLFRGLDEDAQARAWPCLDIAAAAVLVASIAAALVGILIFLSRLADILLIAGAVILATP
jgi:diacylglycerol kinase